MPTRARDWLKQGRKDLEFARRARESGSHEWSCFIAQQAAEKAVKALHLHLGQDVWGHVVARLLTDLPPDSRVPERLVEAARILDNFYIPTRYPNSHSEGAPFEHYGPLQSEQALDRAQEILAYVSDSMNTP